MSRIRNEKGPENAVCNLKDAAKSVLRFAELDKLRLSTEQRDILKKVSEFDVAKIAGLGRDM